MLDDNAAAVALWSDLGRSEDIIILLVAAVDGCEFYDWECCVVGKLCRGCCCCCR